ncbi:uncharacterized protein LOC108670858 [Hyalella azteca]|uniref:E3 ubiquitin-protein ligase n=1 Tax=Hyalella azteca TaxID=294128 RepID=A0A979FSZ5_HYAAZ|nr:uncharacterized protein LOC108670858 [Hyalella azteca]
MGSELVAYHRDPSVPDTPLTPLTPIEGGGSHPLGVPLPAPPPQLALTSSADPTQPQTPPGGDREMVPVGDSTYVVPSSTLSPATHPHDDFIFLSPSDPVPLPAPPYYPPLLAGTEVARPGTAPATGGSGIMVPAGRRRRHTGTTKMINESMVSLLVKLYSKLTSGAPYRPNFDEIPASRVGDGGYFTSLLLNKLGHHDSATRAHILQVVRSLSQGPGLPDAGAAGSEDTDAAEDFRRRAREERSRQAALRKQKVLESFKKKQTKFSEEHKDILGSISTDVETVPSEGSGKSETQNTQVPEGDEAAGVTTSEWSDRMKCAHCSTDREDPLGLVVFILPSSSEAHRRLRVCEGQSFPLTEKSLEALKPENRNTLLGCAKERYQAALAANYHVSWQLWENRGFDFSTTAVTCGHFVHLDCQENYHRNLGSHPNLMVPDDVVLDPRYGDYLCGMCRGYTNATIPLTPTICHWIHTGNVPQKPRAPRNSVQPPPLYEETKTETSVQPPSTVTDNSFATSYNQQQVSAAVNLSREHGHDGSRRTLQQNTSDRTEQNLVWRQVQFVAQDNEARLPSLDGDQRRDIDNQRHHMSASDDCSLDCRSQEKGEGSVKTNLADQPSQVDSSGTLLPRITNSDMCMTFDDALQATLHGGGLEVSVLVYELLRTHEVREFSGMTTSIFFTVLSLDSPCEFSGLTKDNLQTLYERLTGLPLSRIRHILDDSCNTCKLGYLNSCLRTQLECQLSAMGGLVAKQGHESRPGWDPSNLLIVSMFDMLSHSSQAMSQQVLTPSSMRDWVSDRWGQVCLHPHIAQLPTYDKTVMLSDTAPKPNKRYRPSQRYSRHQEYLAPEELEELEETAWRYQRQPVLPVLTSDPIAVLLQFWLMLPHALHIGV